MRSPRFSQCLEASLWISLPDLDTVVGRPSEDASAIKVDVENSDPIIMARLEVVDCRHVLRYRSRKGLNSQIEMENCSNKLIQSHARQWRDLEAN